MRNYLLFFVGEAPSRMDTTGGLAFSGICGRFMDQIVSSFSTWRHEFDGVFNLIQNCQSRDGKGSAFPMPKAKIAARCVMAAIESMVNDGNMKEAGAIIVCAGRRVYKAMSGKSDVQYFKIARTQLPRDGFFSYKPVSLVCFPHPSGVNRWWNSRHNVYQAKYFLKQVTSGEIMP